MRNVLTALVCAVALTLLMGCAAGGELGDDQILSVRDRKTGAVLSLGDGQEEINAITKGGEEQVTADFSDGVHSAEFFDVDGIRIDTKDDAVVAIHLHDDTRWEISSGVRIGMNADKAWEIYEGNRLAETGLEGGILMSFDEDLTPIPFDQDSPYYIVISFEDGKVSYINIQSKIQ